MKESDFNKNIKKAQGMMKQGLETIVGTSRLSGRGWGKLRYCFGDMDGWLDVRGEESGKIVEIGILHVRQCESNQFIANIFPGGLIPEISYACIDEK